MNYMKQVAELLGIPLNTKFRIKTEGYNYPEDYVLTQHGLYQANKRYQSEDILLSDLLCGYADAIMKNTGTITLEPWQVGTLTTGPYESSSVTTLDPSTITYTGSPSFTIKATGTGVKTEEEPITQKQYDKLESDYNDIKDYNEANDIPSQDGFMDSLKKLLAESEAIVAALDEIPNYDFSKDEDDSPVGKRAETLNPNIAQERLRTDVPMVCQKCGGTEFFKVPALDLYDVYIPAMKACTTCGLVWYPKAR